MSNFHRIEQLLEFLKEEPDNPFNLYALALEYQNHDVEKTASYFELLLRNHSSYLPTYYHAAAFYASRDEIEKAKNIYEEGIKLASDTNESHTLKELRNAYLNFQFEND